MEDTKQFFKERKKYLSKVKKEKEKKLANVIGGSLRICCSGGRAQYYHRNDPKDIVGKYIRGSDVGIARQLAQKDYDKKVLEAIERELKAIDKYLQYYPEVKVEDVYSELHRARRELIVPIRETDEQYVTNWLSVEYEGKEFYEDTPEYFTAKGERVRSKSEVIIADALYREGIPYRYEFPIYLEGMGIVHPDFTVLNVRLRKEMYWEHLGMLDDPDYLENALQKITEYEQNGYGRGDKLLLTYETRKNPLNQKQIMNVIRNHLH